MRYITYLTKHARPLTALICSVYGLYLRFTLYAQRGLHPDEVNQLGYTAGSGLLPFWKMYATTEVTAFPGDYLLTFPFVKLFGTNKWLITIPHIIATMIGFYLLYLVCSKYIKSLWGLIIVYAIFSLNFSLTYHAFEFRPYAVLPTLALAVFYLSGRIVCQYASLSNSQKLSIGLFFLFAVGFHAYGILMIALTMSYHILEQSGKRPLTQIIRELLPATLTLAAFAVPLFLWYYIQNPIRYEDNFGRGINTFDFIPNPLIAPGGFLRSLFGNLVGKKALYPLLIGVIGTFLIPHKNKAHQVMFLSLLVLLPIELILFTDLRTCYWFVQRQFVWVMPFFAVWLGWCWDTIFLYSGEIFQSRKIHKSPDRTSN